LQGVRGGTLSKQRKKSSRAGDTGKKKKRRGKYSGP